jgi:hypothetical protein
MPLSDRVRGGVVTYDADQLRQFLELWRRADGNLSLDQMEALAEWQETPEDVREGLQPAIETGRRYAARTAPAPSTPKQAEEQPIRACLKNRSRSLGRLANGSPLSSAAPSPRSDNAHKKHAAPRRRRRLCWQHGRTMPGVSKDDLRRWQGFGGGFPMFPEPPVIERCAHCDFTVSAPLEDARQAFAKHRCDRPQVTASKPP